MDLNAFNEEIPTGIEPSQVAIVHDWLTGMRGGEKCLKEFCEFFPQADIFTLFHLKGKVDAAIEAHSPHVSFLQAFPGLGRYYRYLLPIFPLAVEGFKLNSYPIVLSISHCAAKGVIPGPQSFHVCYCLTPMRYIWDLYPIYFGLNSQQRLPRVAPRVMSHYLRLWDVAASSRVDEFVAISRFVAARIWKYYRRKSQVIYPPIAWDQFRPVSSKRKDYYLVVAADAQYKRLDIVLDACRTIDVTVKIVGKAPALSAGRNALQRYAPKVEWLGWVSDRELRDLYAHCRALIYPGAEDFGLVPVEAQASGRPVIAYGEGGALESVQGVFVGDAARMKKKAWQKGYTGIFFSQPTGKGLAEAIECFESIEHYFDPETIRKWAKQFDRSVFKESWIRFFKEHLPQY